MDIYNRPESTPGIERSRKVSKREHKSIRWCLQEGKVERQVAIAHDDQTYTREISIKPQSFEKLISALTCIDRLSGDSGENSCIYPLEEEDFDDEDVCEIASVIADARGVSRYQ